MSILVLKSEEQLTIDGFSVIKALTNLTDVIPGSVQATFVELHASEIFQLYVQMVNVIRNFNIDTTTGQDLDDRVFEIGVKRNKALKATGKVTILRETAFVKVSTSLYTGLPAPVAGGTKLRVNDASNALFATSGTLIVGRDTANEEEVTYSVAPVDFTNYWEFTVSTFANSHGLDETVILKQGSDATILAGTILTVPASTNSPEITFSLNNDATLLAGEDSISAVDITAVAAGDSQGNIAVNAINGTKAFQSPPFAGARAQNNSRYRTGKDRETDDELRDRFKNAIQSLSRGVKTAILNAIIGLVDPVSSKRVISAQVVLPTTTSDVVTVYIDDGTGFEPTFIQQGFETILTSATGGERRLNLDNFPLVKAQLESNTAEPYDMSVGALTLTYIVGTHSETITFQISDFAFPTAGTAEEIVKAINDKSTLLTARTSQVGKRIVIEARAEENEDIQVTGGTANGIINFPTDARDTSFLYISDVLQSKDGTTSLIDTGNLGSYDFAVLGGSSWPMTIIVDGKSVNTQTVTFTSTDFINSAAATAAEVVTVINAQLAGAVASTINNGLQVRIISNTTRSSSSKLQVTGGAANTPLGFAVSETIGRNKDYTLNRQLGQFELTTPLTVGDSVTAGSQFTRAFLRTNSIESYSIIAAQTLIISVDGGGDQTVTFPSTGALTAAQVVTIVNAQITGATASVRSISNQNFLEMTTNSQAKVTGSIEVKSTSTATTLDFAADTVISNQRPHKAFVVSGASGNFIFTLGDTLIVVIDEDPSTKTFIVPMDFDGTLTATTTASLFKASAFTTIFATDDELNDFHLVMISGVFTSSTTVDTITNQGGNTWRYAFDSLPTSMANYIVGDHYTAANSTNTENDGSFIITGVSSAGNGFVEVTNAPGIAESAGSPSTGTISQRRQITDYTAATGEMTLGVALTATPAISDTFSILPRTSKNLQDYMGNTTITTLSTKAISEAVDNASKLQISALSNGSDGAVQVTGGRANAVLSFTTTGQTGLEAYNYYTGLLKLVHRTIYGDDSDPIGFPGVGAAGITFNFKAPTVEEISVGLDVTLAEGVSISNVRADILSAVTGYFSDLGIGDDVILAELVAAVMEISNITDVSITSPTTNVTIADGELASTRDSLITTG